jgi:hypothetical protein
MVMEVGRVVEPEEAVAGEFEVRGGEGAVTVAAVTATVVMEGVAVMEEVVVAVVVAEVVVEVGVELACAGRRGPVDEREGAGVRVEVRVEVELGAEEVKREGGEVVKEECKVDDG